MPAGRPTKYSKQLAEKICSLVATTKRGLVHLCKEHEDLPTESTIYLWRYHHPEFSQKYLEAKRAQIDLIMEELDDVLDENTKYYYDEHGNERIDSPSATLAIAKANNRKWFASKIAPKMYGDTKKEESNTDEKSVLEKILNGEITVNK